MTTLNSLVHNELDRSVKTLNVSHHTLMRVAQENSQSPVGKFISRALEWRTDTSKSVWLHMFLGRVIRCDSTFMTQLSTFVERNILGAESYVILWRGAGDETLSPNDLMARPQVDRKWSLCFGDKSAQDLLDAMDVMERRESVQAARYVALEDMVD